MLTAALFKEFTTGHFDDCSFISVLLSSETWQRESGKEMSAFINLICVSLLEIKRIFIRVVDYNLVEC